MRTLCLAALACTLSAASLAAKPPGRGATGGEVVTELSPAVKKRIQASCFEVVVLRPEKDSLTYEKELPWDLVPFHIRNDKYLSIGTAFAVSSTDLVTAFHVLDLHQDPLSFPRYFIRDAEQHVYEIDQVLLAHEHRDIVRFNVKGRTFSQWLELEPGYEVNQPVFTAGNAYGEGIVVRRGDLIGTLPEEMDGAWSWLKSSADVNAGNSGGPLLDIRGRVIGLVVLRKDNLCYSLPTSEIGKLKASTAAYYNKIGYSFELFPEKSKFSISAFEFPLPMGYRELKLQAFQKRFASYEKDMEALFAEQKELFPKGPTSQEVIQETPTSNYPEVIFKDPNSSRWTLTDAKVERLDLGDNGYLGLSSTSNLLLLRIRKPDSLAYLDLVEKPKVAMDLVFKGLNIPREIGGQKIRITSLGEPIRTVEHRDRYGRPWRIAIWHMEYSDRVVFLCSTPVPSGLAAVLKEIASPGIETWLYDLKKILDFVYVPYTGRLKEWGPFLDQPPARLPEAFKAVRTTYEAGKSFRLRTPWLDLDLDKRSQALAPDDTLGLFMGFDRRNDEVAWALRRLSYSEYEGDNYFVWNNHLKPVPDLEEARIASWREIAQARHPYTRTAFAKEGRTDISSVLKSFVPKGVQPEDAPNLFTLYVGRTGTVPDGAMRKVIDTIADGLKPAAARTSTDAGRPAQ